MTVPDVVGLADALLQARPAELEARVGQVDLGVVHEAGLVVHLEPRLVRVQAGLLVLEHDRAARAGLAVAPVDLDPVGCEHRGATLDHHVALRPQGVAFAIDLEFVGIDVERFFLRTGVAEAEKTRRVTEFGRLGERASRLQEQDGEHRHRHREDERHARKPAPPLATCAQAAIPGNGSKTLSMP
ncbi:MAG: hypothetical protein WCH13_06595 [Deltaproteobacteria bacterium]